MLPSKKVLMPPLTAADFNDDGIVDILDIVQIVNYILRF